MTTHIPLSAASFLLALPPPPKLLLLPAPQVPIALPPASRAAQMLYTYHGLPLWLRGEQQHGILHKIVVSYCDPLPVGHRAQRGKIVLSERYTPISDNPLPAGDPIPADVIQATLDHAVPTYFLPKLIAQRPGIKSCNMLWGLIGLYAYYRLVSHDTVSEGYQHDRQKAMERMLRLWGDRPLCMITPEHCGPDLLTLPPTVAKDCVRLLRKLFALELGLLTTDPKMWDRYNMSVFSSSYSPRRAIQSSLLNVPWTPPDTKQAIKKCLAGIKDSKYAGHYLVALAMIMDGISIEEGCALVAGSMQKLPEYHQKYGLIIDHTILDRGTSTGHKHREQQKQRVLIADPHQKRHLPVSDTLASAWIDYRSCHPGTSDSDLIITHPKNANRIMPINTYRKWLDAQFGDYTPPGITVSNQTITATYDVDDYMLATAIEQMIKAGYTAEELRYCLGRTPQMMAARHYAGYDCPAEQAKMGAMQDAQYVQDHGYTPQPDNRKQYIANGIGHKTTVLRCRIRIPANTDDKHLMIRLSARFGLATASKVIPDTNIAAE